MVDSYKPTGKESSAPFNMALNTLERLGEILTELKQISSHTEYSDETKQYAKISYVKQFFIQATPLLKKTIVEKYKTEVLGLKPATRQIMENTGLGTAKDKGIVIRFSPDLDIQLDTYIVDLQMALQEEGYFMPPKNDPRFAFKRE